MVLKHRHALEKEETQARKMHFYQAVMNLIQQSDSYSYLEAGELGVQVITLLSPVRKLQSCSSSCPDV